jgi:hypothetical protein
MRASRRLVSDEKSKTWTTDEDDRFRSMVEAQTDSNDIATSRASARRVKNARLRYRLTLKVVQVGAAATRVVDAPHVFEESAVHIELVRSDRF